MAGLVNAGHFSYDALMAFSRLTRVYFHHVSSLVMRTCAFITLPNWEIGYYSHCLPKSHKIVIIIRTNLIYVLDQYPP